MNLSEQLKIIGVTGTNGKTTITYCIATLLNALADKACGLIGTLGVGYPDNFVASGYTTPPGKELRAALAKLQQHSAYCALEVSSHGIAQRRIEGLNFSLGIYSNLSSEHLDYHKTMANYWQTKASFFTDYQLERALINADCPFGRSLLASNKDAVGYSLFYRSELASRLVFVQNLIKHKTSTTIEFASPWGNQVVTVPIIGAYNISNVLAACAAVLWLTAGAVDLTSIAPKLELPPGRMQFLGAENKPTVVIDYAHTAAALKVCLQSLRERMNRKIWCVFGCGGDRDKLKRPEMLQVACRYADQVIITSDNPRTESLDNIIADMVSGNEACNYEIEPDRATAIASAVKRAALTDIILIAGKGHEEYQIFAKNTIAFSDYQVAKQQLEIL